MKYLCDGNDSNIFNLGNGVGFTVKEVVETARKVTGHPISAKEEPRRAGDPSMLIASSAKAKEVLGWNPQYADLETIIDTAWNWHKSHPNGYQNVGGGGVVCFFSIQFSQIVLLARLCMIYMLKVSFIES